MAEQAKTGDRKDNAKQAIVQLLALGQKKGELTYEEIGDALARWISRRMKWRFCLSSSISSG